jgi:hypothetical protein
MRIVDFQPKEGEFCRNVQQHVVLKFIFVNRLQRATGGRQFFSVAKFHPNSKTLLLPRLVPNRLRRFGVATSSPILFIQHYTT